MAEHRQGYYHLLCFQSLQAKWVTTGVAATQRALAAVAARELAVEMVAQAAAAIARLEEVDPPRVQNGQPTYMDC